MGLFAVVAPVHAQTPYVIRKSQVSLQTSGQVTSGSSFSATITAPPTGRYVFTAQTPAAVTLTLPTGMVQALPPSTAGGFLLSQSFGSQAALDAAFPNGTYRMSGASMPDLALNLSPDSYPVSEPVVLRTNWNNGVHVVDPSVAVTFTFGNTASYASAATGAHMSFSVVGLSDAVNLKTEVWNKAVFGFPATTSQLSSYVVPAGSLAAGRLYRAELVWDVMTTLDSTAVASAGGIAAYSKVLRFYVVGRASGDAAPPPPVITSQPPGQSASVGGTVTFNVGVTIGGAAATAENMPTVLWFFNGEQLRIDGTKYTLANGVGLTIQNVSASDAGRYFAHVVNAGGLVTTTASTLTVGSPTITRQPASVTVAPGDTTVFSVAATGTPAPTYRWRLNGTDVPVSVVGARSPMLLVPNASSAQAGTYTVVVTSGQNSVTSTPATLVVSPSRASPGRLINLSILTALDQGESMSMGTVLGGAGTSGNKALLARVAGPSLSQLGVMGFLPDPTMVLLNTSQSPTGTVATNDNWNGASALSTAFASVGAFPYTSVDSKDAAIFQTSLSPGNYTVQVQDAGRGSGTVIAEIYDATAPGTFAAQTPRLINVSVMKSIATGGSLTAGFVIGGTTARTVLVRAIGPGLAALGVSDAMPDPQLTLTNTSLAPVAVIASNNDWGGEPAIAESAGRVGAFAILNTASRDAMILATLTPGNYAAEVAATTGTQGGTTIVEVYEVP